MTCPQLFIGQLQADTTISHVPRPTTLRSGEDCCLRMEGLASFNGGAEFVIPLPQTSAFSPMQML